VKTQTTVVWKRRRSANPGLRSCLELCHSVFVPPGATTYLHIGLCLYLHVSWDDICASSPNGHARMGLDVSHGLREAVPEPTNPDEVDSVVYTLKEVLAP